MRRAFRYLQIFTGPRRSPSACSEKSKKRYDDAHRAVDVPEEALWAREAGAPPAGPPNQLQVVLICARQLKIAFCLHISEHADGERRGLGVLRGPVPI